MVFDGEHLSPFDEGLLDDLRTAHPAAVGPVDASVDLPGGHRPRARGRRPAALATLAFVAFVALVASLAVATRPGGDDQARVDNPPSPDNGQDVGMDPGRIDAAARVNAALLQTTTAERFDVAYKISGTPGSTPPATQCVDVATGSAGKRQFVVPGSAPMSLPPVTTPDGDAAATPSSDHECFQLPTIDPTTNGQGTITLAPKEMVVNAFLAGGLAVTLHLKGDQVWEIFGATPGQPPTTAISGPPQQLSKFAGLVEGSLGARAGTLSMTRLASSNAYLSLESPSISTAAPAGTGTVDGVPVTEYDLSVDLSQLLDQPGLTDDERLTIQDALEVLHGQHYASTTVRVSVDDDGFIRHLDSVAHFEDGGTVRFEATYSNFQCGTPAGPCPSAAERAAAGSTTTTSPGLSGATSTSPTTETIVTTATTATPSSTGTTSGGTAPSSQPSTPTSQPAATASSRPGLGGGTAATG